MKIWIKELQHVPLITDMRRCRGRKHKCPAYDLCSLCISSAVKTQDRDSSWISLARGAYHENVLLSSLTWFKFSYG